MRLRRLSKTARTRLIGAVLVAASILVTVWLGIRSASKTPPNATESGVLVIFAGVLQIMGGAAYSRVGRADPGHARSSVRRLLQIAARTSQARQQVEAAYDEQGPSKSKAVLGQVSVHLSYIEDAAMLAVEDWNEFHEDALRDIVDSSRLTGTNGGVRSE